MEDDKDPNSIYYAEISHPSWDAPIISFSDFHIEPPRRNYSGFLPPRISSMEYPQMQNPPKGPFPSTPEGQEVNTVELANTWLRGTVGDLRPSAKVLLHPIVRNYWAIAIIEHDTRRTAVIRNGYVELVAK